MTATTVVNTALTINTGANVTWSAATSTVANATEVLEITPTRRSADVLMIVKNGAVDKGTIGVSVAAGGLWAATDALAFDVAQGKDVAIVLESAKYKSTAGVFSVTLDPAADQRLATDHAASVAFIELP